MSGSRLVTLGIPGGGAAYVPPFSPLSISGLQLWLKADSLVLNDADPVGTWADQSGSGNDAAQATAAKKPLYKTNIVNGKPVVRFDGTDDFVAVANFAAFPSKRGTIFVVAKNAAVPVAFRGYLGNGAALGFEFMNDGFRYAWYDGVSTSPVETVTIDTNWQILELVRSADTTMDFYRNGTQKTGTTIANNQPSAAALNIGCYNVSSEFQNGDTAEVIVYNSALSAANRQSVERYLGSKYGITVP